MKTYNGHRSWNCWNVSLWISGDEAYYYNALEAIRRTKNKKLAAKMILANYGKGHKTPDGGKFNFTSVYNAIKDLT